jgi:hypothetical protein
MPISFESEHMTDFATGEVRFHALHNGVKVLCRVTSEALHDYINAGSTWTDQMALKAFEDCHERIEAVAAVLIEKGYLEKNGSVLITSDRLQGTRV